MGDATSAYNIAWWYAVQYVRNRVKPAVLAVAFKPGVFPILYLLIKLIDA